jgi:NAD+ kinase
MRHIHLIFKEEDPLVRETARQIQKDLEVLRYQTSTDPKAVKTADLVLSLGGDGTIFRTARLASPFNIPILGIHLGGVGFLAEIELLELRSALEKIKKRKYRLEKRTMLEGKVLRKGKGVKTFVALNDLVISKRGIARLIEFEVYSRQVLIGGYKADGLIISSATGSTAYNLSAGGPLLLPESKEFILSAICPHALISRPVVTSNDLYIKLLRGKDALLTSDGQELFGLATGDEVSVSRARQVTKFIRFKKYNLFERIREKLGRTS